MFLSCSLNNAAWIPICNLGSFVHHLVSPKEWSILPTRVRAVCRYRRAASKVNICLSLWFVDRTTFPRWRLQVGQFCYPSAGYGNNICHYRFLSHFCRLQYNQSFTSLPIGVISEISDIALRLFLSAVLSRDFWLKMINIGGIQVQCKSTDFTDRTDLCVIIKSTSLLQ